ncbi:MAG: hypothetical protein HC771_13155 [Synechococcales cyanobacterium CRU_2_2]|nr:hypothetical protein [Synechococcales cyanobacterium CRU_2_2]
MQLSSQLPEAEPLLRLQGGDRYAHNWSAVSRRARRICPVCCWCQRAAAVETHHAMYWDEKGAIAGREIPGVHVFPVCEECHTVLHRDHWFSPDDHLARRNTPHAIDRLRAGWGQQAKKRIA